MIQDENSSSRLVIQNLNLDEFNERWIRDTFTQFGVIIDLDIPKQSRNSRDPRSNQIFIQYVQPDSVYQAIKEMNGKMIGNRILSVSRFDNVDFKRIVKKQIYEQNVDTFGIEQGLEPPAFQKIPRRDPENIIIKIPRPQTPPDPPQDVVPVPPAYELPVTDYQALIQNQMQRKQIMPNYKEDEKDIDNDRYMESEIRKREEIHIRHNRDRERNDKRRREERKDRKEFKTNQDMTNEK